METIAAVLVGIVALEHLFIMILEMFFIIQRWQNELSNYLSI